MVEWGGGRGETRWDGDKNGRGKLKSLGGCRGVCKNLGLGSEAQKEWLRKRGSRDEVSSPRGERRRAWGRGSEIRWASF